MGICKELDCGDGCIPTCSDSEAGCSAPFITSSDYGAIYYQIALCCGSQWLEEHGDTFVSLGPLMVWLVATPLLKVAKRLLLRSCLSSLCGISYGDDEDPEAKSYTASSKTDVESTSGSMFTTINGIVQLCCSAVACWSYFFRTFHVHKVNSQCDSGHCRFLIFMAIFLYKPFIVPIYQTVTAATQVIRDAYLARSTIRSLLFTCHGCLLIPYMVGIFLTFLLPTFIYSLILLILFCPMYLSIFLLLAIPAWIGTSILIRNDFTQEARVYSAVNSGYVFILAFVYTTLSVSKLYYGCGWKYTVKALYMDSFSAYTLTSGLSWPDSSSNLAQGTLIVSLASGFICGTLETLTKLLVKARTPSSSTSRMSHLPPHTSLELASRVTTRVWFIRSVLPVALLPIPPTIFLTYRTEI